MGKSILIVDDSRVMRAIIHGYLAPLPEVDLREAGDGAAAVEAYRQSRPDLVLLDLTMPVMDGLTALQEIKAMDPSAFVVVLTADVQVKSVERVMAAGAHSLLKKPPIKEQVLELIQLLDARAKGQV